MVCINQFVYVDLCAKCYLSKISHCISSKNVYVTWSANWLEVVGCGWEPLTEDELSEELSFLAEDMLSTHWVRTQKQVGWLHLNLRDTDGHVLGCGAMYGQYDIEAGHGGPLEYVGSGSLPVRTRASVGPRARDNSHRNDGLVPLAHIIKGSVTSTPAGKPWT